MTNISDTINNAVGRDVARSYGSYVRRVVDAVSNREDQIKANLRRYAEGRGLSSREVDDLFIEVGLAERPVAQATGDPVQQGLAEIAAQVQDLHNRLDALSRQG